MNMVFVLQPGGPKETRLLRSEIMTHSTASFAQLIGDQPWFAEITDVYDGIAKLFTTSADILIAMLEPTVVENDVIMVAQETFDLLASTMNLAVSDHPQVLGAQSGSEPPIYNILPPFDAQSYQLPRLSDRELSDLALGFLFQANPKPASSIAGVSVDLSNRPYDMPVNGPGNPWVTVKDNLTSELYCLAVYDGEVNGYSGPCRYDEYD